VKFAWDSEVVEVLGEMKVSGVRLRNVRSGATSELECAGVFPFFGVEPNTAFLPPSLLGPSGLVAAGADLATPDPRVFAVGAVRANYGGNLVEAMAEGVSAARAAVRVLVN